MGDSCMLNSLSARWQTLKTKYKKFIPFIFTFIFCLSPLSVSAAEVSPDANTEWFLLPFDKLHFDSTSVVGQFDSNSGTYNASLVGSSYWPTWGCSDVGAVMPHFKSGNTYLFYYTFSFVNDSLSDDSDLLYLRRVYTDANTSARFNNISSSAYYVNSTTTVSGISKYTFNSDYNLSTSSASLLHFPSICSSSGRVSWAFYALDITENTDSEVNQIITAINNQTDFIVNGDSSTGGIVSGADSSKSELESIVSEYQEIENSMLDNFTLYQDEILVDLRGWSWGGLRSCAKWVGDTLTNYYNNLGDFKQYIIYPLLLGIALFFIGRGSSIIGHLYRKPTVTTTYTESTSTRYRSGNHSGTNTSTTTYREGGVLRK